MKATNYSIIAIASSLVFLLSVNFLAQEDRHEHQQPDAVERPRRPQDHRLNALRELGLSEDQLQQVRRLNIERRPLMQEAQQRVRTANRALDTAIYADEMNAASVQEALKGLNTAQAEVARIRFMNEFEIRKLLTPAQLERFRELRARFDERRRDLDRGLPRPRHRIRERRPENDRAVPTRHNRRPLPPAIRPN